MMQTVQGVIDDGYLVSVEHQRKLASLVGEGTPYDPAHGGRYDVDLAEGTIVFSTPGEPVAPLTMRAHLLGSAAPGPGTWLWAWEDLIGLPDDGLAYVRHVRDFGERMGLSELTVAHQPLTGTPRMEAVTYATIAATICGGMAHYTLDAGRGTIAALLLDAPELALGDPSAVRAATVLPEAAAAALISDWRRAVRSYAQMRGLAFAEDPTSATLTAPDGVVVATFDPQGRLSNVSADLS